ncbi:hypothetical protein PCO31111_04210 [Pandoraea communis]|uniref:Uncharacterized protein n=1 Tax=Pandoraea communis TaxID=2508297 RepID=A0A5E4XZD5_9BURK|nr:hypothetical protein PCO31111_04210 [Pandoraea communis]
MSTRAKPVRRYSPRGASAKEVTYVSLEPVERQRVAAFAVDCYPGVQVSGSAASRSLIKTALLLREKHPQTFRRLLGEVREKDDQEHAKSIGGK